MRTAKFPKPNRTAVIRGARQTERRQLHRKAYELWRQVVRAKEPSGICPVCRKRAWHDAMHGFAKGPHKRLEFEPDNGAPGCRPCHRRIDSDHDAKEQFWRRYIGDARYERLRLLAHARTGRIDLALVITDLREVLRSMEGA